MIEMEDIKLKVVDLTGSVDVATGINTFNKMVAVETCNGEMVLTQDQCLKLLEYTKFQDKNDVDIYEDDILKSAGEDYLIILRNGCWVGCNLDTTEEVFLVKLASISVNTGSLYSPQHGNIKAQLRAEGKK